MKSKIQTVHQKPRCSLTKLGEYVAKQSSPARRREIIKTQKIPPTVRIANYTPATSVIVDHLIHERHDSNLIEAIGHFFASQDSKEKFARQQAKMCRDAISAFRKVAPQVELADCALDRGPRTWSVEIAGVTVSVRPELLLRLRERTGVKALGLVKLYFSKTHRLDEHSAGVISAVMLSAAEQRVPEGYVVSKRHIVVVDVFAGKVYTAPNATKRLLNEATAACEEIAFYWQSISAS